VLGEKLDHKAIKKPGLLYLAGMAGPGKVLNSQFGITRLKREGPLMAAVFAAGSG